jgi:hypothetical protein
LPRRSLFHPNRQTEEELRRRDAYHQFFKGSFKKHKLWQYVEPGRHNHPEFEKPIPSKGSIPDSVMVQMCVAQHEIPELAWSVGQFDSKFRDWTNNTRWLPPHTPLLAHLIICPYVCRNKKGRRRSLGGKKGRHQSASGSDDSERTIGSGNDEKEADKEEEKFDLPNFTKGMYAQPTRPPPRIL